MNWFIFIIGFVVALSIPPRVPMRERLVFILFSMVFAGFAFYSILGMAGGVQ